MGQRGMCYFWREPGGIIAAVLLMRPSWEYDFSEPISVSDYTRVLVVRNPSAYLRRLTSAVSGRWSEGGVLITLRASG